MTIVCQDVSDAISPIEPVKATSKTSWFLRVLEYIDTVLERAHWRHELSLLGDAGLKDIGLSRADVERETTRSYWDVTDHY